MNNIVRETVKRHNLLKKGDRVIVALSGGADSCALLRVLLCLREEYDLTLYCAHINHSLRGEESDRDEAFVRKLTKELGIELFVKRADIKALSKEMKISEELCGRNVRYEFLRELSEKLSAKVATAHTLSDCEETMLFNMARGTSLHGLCSIPYKRDFIVRPLLDVTRQQVEEYMKEGNYPFVDDSTNFIEDICTRNRIRHLVLPPLKSISDGFDKNFMKLRRQLSAADDFIEKSARDLLSQSKKSFGYDAEMLLTSHEALRSRAIALCIADRGVAPSDRFVSLISEILGTSGALPLKDGVYAVCTQGVFRIVSDIGFDEFAPISVRDGVCVTYDGKTYVIKKTLDKSDAGIVRISADKITSSTVLRRRMPEDTFAPLKRGVRKSLRKLQNELKIPAELRERSLVIAHGSTVLWAEHIGVSEDGFSKDVSEDFYVVEII